MSRLIIENATGVSMLEAIDRARSVVEKGRISNNGSQYCYATTFADGTNAYATLNSKSDKIVVTREKFAPMTASEQGAAQ